MAGKLVIVVDEGLERGVAANVIGLLGISVGRHVEGIVGPDVVDASGISHRGMSTIGLPVLAADDEALNRLYQEASDHPGITVLDVTDAAVSSRDYDAYTQRLQDPERGWRPLGLALTGPRRQVDRLTGRLGLLR
ncbi:MULTISPECIES: DUF2000 domain-containing protein [Streptomyces]|uniref:DUF2000 domain-containing protein n=3 Tax=Streptomyces TaxID=1883 RepID=A0A0A0NS10_STRRN|nr:MULTISPECIES: DUF2000 domain-containing protein [Streptomyces]AGP60176.1 hypothetical protein M271_44040 [Streptomyces rapamycinicus NRRL 5491]MBB4788662.1 hypothetical protein [Streptomyces rapamycinicus]RLV72991.1 hypothetical protein D3C57_150730 [Streptomyces rapamycinicus NRRL 5491]RSS31891.1 DUF2000 domain-containing protein [Streptomyces sp. WAC05858]UTP35767.1 DUF2000 domain-containing protein [Streptomyces rapamycinicus NRRL 5491]